MGVKEECAHSVIDGANGTLGLAVLWRGVGKGETQYSTVASEKSIDG